MLSITLGNSLSNCINQFSPPSNPAGEPNVMEQDLDMNGNKIINVGDVEVGGANILTEMQTIYDDYEALTSRVTISTNSPTGGTNGDIWFKVSV